MHRGEQQPNAFDIWDYIESPTTPVYEDDSYVNYTSFLHNTTLYLPIAVRDRVGIGYVMLAAKVALLAHTPSDDPATQALLHKTIPPGDTAQREVRYMAAFKEEIALGYDILAEGMPSQAKTYFDTLRRLHAHPSYRTFTHGLVDPWIEACRTRARKILERMTFLEGKQMTGLASDADFVRESALVSLDQLDGFQIRSGPLGLTVRTRPGASWVPFATRTTLDAASFDRVATTNDGSFTLVAKDAPILYTITGSRSQLLAAKGTRAFTSAETTLGVKVVTLLAPSVDGGIDAQSLSIGEVQTVSFTHIFEGAQVTYSVASEQTSVCTAVLSSTPNTIAITGVGTGTANIRLTATNAAGNTSITFEVTVTQ